MRMSQWRRLDSERRSKETELSDVLVQAALAARALAVSRSRLNSSTK